jgi:transposase
MALGRGNWMFAGSLRAGQRAANVMSLIQSAKLNGHDPYRYLKDVLERLPTQPASRLEELLPHWWQLPLRSHSAIEYQTPAEFAAATHIEQADQLR